MRTMLLAVLTFAAAIPASTVSAQSGPPPIELPGARSARPSFPYLGVDVYNGQLPEGSPVVIRRARADGDVADWIDPADPLVARVTSGEARGGMGILVLDISPDGRATACRPHERFTAPQLTDGLCERVLPRVRAIPALAEDGTRVADRIDLTLAIYSRTTRPERPVSAAALPPVMAAPTRWPPDRVETGVVVTGLPMAKGGAAAAEASGGTWAGISYDGLDPRMPCRVVDSSGDPMFNTRACVIAAKGKYDVSVAAPGRRRATILFVLQNGKPRAILPVAEAVSSPAITPDSRAAVSAALAAIPANDASKLQLFVGVNAAGEPSICRIGSSTGHDRYDALACRVMRETGRFTPASDIFGRPLPGFMRWRPTNP